ncbi:DUF3298 and DUF4163 domain-containing protein [Brevibacillus ruminantium]|uniref:DUF3298 and DUF4163 domain-containing protein n=1 Tax=Brevibacillus ruminantium TaxID=2950604 RepID=A0ABY4WFB3_9BACL|nr:DUF3298 and DUF4163 domain-containing protein [Brevibacillus ruminantium]USG65429.1 DUF3298 and DUF4163 domain-containing protein [Brevibacillus ruminantium]
MTPLKPVVSSLLGTAVLLTAICAPVVASTAATAKPAASPAQKTAPAVQPSAAQAKGVVLTPKTMKLKTAEYEAEISYPVISGLTDKAFEAKLNEELQKSVQSALQNTQTQSKEGAADAKKYGYEFRPYALDISYKAHVTGKLVSIAVQTYQYTGGAHGMTGVDYYNIANQDQAKKLQLADLFQPGYDYRSILNLMITQQIKTNKELGFADDYEFPGISEDQAFAFENGDLVIHFGQYEIGPYAIGMPAFTIPSRSVNNLFKPEIRNLLHELNTEK